MEPRSSLSGETDTVLTPCEAFGYVHVLDVPVEPRAAALAASRDEQAFTPLFGGVGTSSGVLDVSHNPVGPSLEGDGDS